MNPRWLALMTDGKGYLTTGSPQLNGHHQCRLYHYRYKLKNLPSSPGTTRLPSPGFDRATQYSRASATDRGAAAYWIPAFAGRTAWDDATHIERRQDEKIRREQTPADLIVPRSDAVYAFMAPFTASAVIGSERTRAPQALKIALASAGAITVTAGSPTPVAFSPLAMTLMATSGT